MKLKLRAAALLLAAAMVTGCGGNTDTAVTTDAAANVNTTAETEQEIDYSALSDEEIRQLMVERSLMTVGNTARMEKALAKAAEGKEITVAYIGGSITEGLTAGADLCWARLSYNWLCEQYPEAKINYTNAGMSGTPSTLGLIRSDRDVIDKGQPDIVFIEFAVNDSTDLKSKQNYESLVRKMLKLSDETAVVLLFTVIKSGYTCEEHMSKVGEYYSLPMISLNNVLAPEFESGRMKWEDYSDDESHPNEWGHELVAEMVENYFKKVMDIMKDGTGDKETAEIPAETLNGADNTSMKLLDLTNLAPNDLGSWADKETLAQFPNGWEYVKGGSNEPIRFTINCNTLYVIFRAQNSERLGTIDVYVDGEKVMDVKGNMSSGWNNPETQWIMGGGETAEHTVEIKMADGSEENYFWLLGFGYCD